MLTRYHFLGHNKVHNYQREKGFCVLSNGEDQDSGVKKLNSVDGNTTQAQQECLKLCASVHGVTGCEVIWNLGNKGCYAHTQDISHGNGDDRHFCWVFSKSSKAGKLEKGEIQYINKFSNNIA